jgi:hypothetical protein
LPFPDARAGASEDFAKDSLTLVQRGEMKVNNREDENNDGKQKKSEIARDRNASVRMIKVDRTTKIPKDSRENESQRKERRQCSWNSYHLLRPRDLFASVQARRGRNL